MVTSLSEDKKIAVREIGFRSFLSSCMTNLPKKLSKYLVQKFNIQNLGIRLEHATINIDEEDMNLVLGILNGTKTIDEFSKDTDEIEEHKAFIRQKQHKYSKFPAFV